MKRKILLALVLVVLVGAGLYVYKMHINHNFEEVTEGKVYKSGVIPPDEIAEYVKKYKIKSIVDLRFPGQKDVVNNPEVPEEMMAEQEAVKKIEGLNYFNNGSDQVPTQENLKYFYEIMDNKDNYPVLLHCYHGVGRAEIYTAIYKIEYEGMSNEQARLDTRILVKGSSFDLGKPKGDFLHNYKTRKQLEQEKLNK